MSTLPSEMRVGDVLLPLDRIPVVKPTTLLKTTLETMEVSDATADYMPG